MLFLLCPSHKWDGNELIMLLECYLLPLALANGLIGWFTGFSQIVGKHR
jgi:hypothetical protein